MSTATQPGRLTKDEGPAVTRGLAHRNNRWTADVEPRTERILETDDLESTMKYASGT